MKSKRVVTDMEVNQDDRNKFLRSGKQSKAVLYFS